MTTQDLDKAKDAFRDRVLAALDEAAEEVFGQSLGAKDADLPEIFKCIDAQMQRLAVRFEHPLYENYIGTAKWRAEREFLQSMGFVLRADSAA